MENLYEKLNTQKEAIRKYAPKVIEIPKYISDNLKYDFFEWQKEAFENLLMYENDHKKYPAHLMFNMATGTGKTLIMASAILYYYKQGYRKFIFFVNQNNIVDKTENNFIVKTHNKYLFKERIVIDDKTIEIKKVNTFSKNNDSIEIKFTTIQKLYNDIHIERENQVYLDDLIKKDIVMLADEAHHLNADTKSKNGQEELDLDTELKEGASEKEIEKKGWEHTVIELLLNKNGKSEGNKNILLEFTATIPENQKVIDKYASKTLYKFDLRQFLSAGYTKEINLVSSTLEKKERILQVLIFNWYRDRIALKNNIPNFKPVILFRSKTIEESKKDFNEFFKLTQSLKVSDFDFLKNIEDKFNEGEEVYEQGKSRVLDVIQFIKKEKIKITEIIDFIKYNFIERNCIITNSKTNKTKKEKTDEDQEKLLNSLEDKNNHIRAIFTVNRLTEGWDVLNLFDIVRLYKGRDEGKDTKGERKAGSTTISEIQLIGRGVRYCPFAYKDIQKNKRKFDENLKNEMRVLEELYYHSDSDHRYIDELKRELKKKGFIDDGKVVKVFKLKKEFIESDFYKDVMVWKNEQIDNPERRKKTLNDLKENLKFKFNLHNLGIKEQELDFDSENTDIERLNINETGLKTITKEIKAFEKHIFYKALNSKAKSDKSLFRFELLKEELDIESIEDFRKDFIGNFKIQIITKDKEFEDITNKEKLVILSRFFDAFLFELKLNINPYKGTEFKTGKFSDLFDEVKKSVKKDEHSQRLEDELKYEEWYVIDSFYGTSEEKGLIEFIKETIGNLQKKYKEVYLLRNEEQYKIYDFKTGQGFQPDFILFLKETQKLYYQVFIEPKGDNLLDIDKWKNDFLKEITKKYHKDILRAESKDYILIGLPLFNINEDKEFKEEYNKIIT
ncbi:type III restriction endonuclease [Candidatus Nomurabacteria bacterium CG_4_10_14_0_2_um_filter_30_12]|uniref:Type III restriction endonuclease n=2 Tax=Candidatus Nomuraibacteriota TaxID=1752729 RepID=A0A2J0MK82_9BACT|nr:MAG: type III restriction endonuclease [Candidatus Nomurabacteria bacterium CG10_big_fil_rev_8_21_14_0_10_03_31_7]PIZ86964.1 MAG: type III restriction endonuclease [Candidatus Nomurabacteria bacterium CG_4_10_14_0_2_um_filter_30_12]